MATRMRILTVVLVLSVAVTGLALASDGLTRPRAVLGGGATVATAGDVGLRATLGQPVVGMVSGGQTGLGQGFWHSGAATAGGRHIYLPLVMRDA